MFWSMDDVVAFCLPDSEAVTERTDIEESKESGEDRGDLILLVTTECLTGFVYYNQCWVLTLMRPTLFSGQP